MSGYRPNTTLANLHENTAYQYGLLAAITLLAAVLRFYKLGEWSLWIDEIFTINRAEIHLNDMAIFLRNLPDTLWLPLSLIFTKFFLNLFGVSEWSARLAPALIGILSIPILYFSARKVIGSGAALVMALLLAVSPWHLFWSQNARFYTSLMLIYTLAAFAFFFAFERNRPRYILLFYVFLYFAASERLTVVFILPVILMYLATLWLFRFELPPGLGKRNLIILIAPMLLMATVDVIRYLATGSSIMIFAIDAFAGQQFDDPPRLLVAIGFNISLPIISLALVGGLHLLLRKRRVGLFFMLSALLPMALLVILNPFMFTKDRYVFMTLPCWLILAAIAIQELITHTKEGGKLLAVGILLVLVAEAAGTNLLYYRVNNGGRRDWRAAFEIMKSESREDDVFVAWWPEFGPYYLGKEIIPWKDIRPDAVLESGVRYWFLVDSETIWGNPVMREWVMSNTVLIDVLYLRLPEDDFNLMLYLYDPAKNLVRE